MQTPSTSSALDRDKINSNFVKHLSPNRRLLSPSTSVPNHNEISVTPSPSQSKNSLIRPMPSVSCKSAVSIQSFHTALGDNMYDQDEYQTGTSTATNINEANMSKRPHLAPLYVVNEESSTLKLETDTQKKHPPNILPASHSIVGNEFCSHYSTGPPTFSGSSMMIHPMALVHSHTSGSIPNNFFYYGSLDSGALSKSPVGSYFHDYYSEDYEVVLDDGTRQKRSVSLSTMPVVTPLEFGQKRYKGNYNHYYYQEDVAGHRQKTTSKSQANE